MENFEMQFICILSSYFAISVYNLKEQIKFFKIADKELQVRVNLLTDTIQMMSEEIKELKKKYIL